MQKPIKFFSSNAALFLTFQKEQNIMFSYRSLLLICTLTISMLLVNACSTTPPALASGNDTWLLKSVTFPDSVKTATGDTVRSTDENYVILYAEFECIKDKSLVSLWLGTDGSALASSSMYMQDGFSNVYITDDKGEKYAAVLIEQCSIAGLVPKNGAGFTLQFKDLQPLSLGK